MDLHKHKIIFHQYIEQVSKVMLIRKIEYDEVITALDKIIETDLFKD